MRATCYICLLALCGGLRAQRDSLAPRLAFGCSAGLITFADYSIAKEQLFDKTAYYQGFDLSLFMRTKSRHFQFDLGIMAGDKYPLRSGLNYYLGAAYLFYSPGRRYVFDLHPRFMLAYSDEHRVIRKEISVQLGAGAARKWDRAEIGLRYYAWASDAQVLYKLQQQPAVEKFRRTGFVPIGVLMLSARFFLKKAWCRTLNKKHATQNGF